MKQWLLTRNNWHYIAGFALAPLMFLLAFQGREIFGRTLVSFGLTFFIAVAWEFYRGMTKSIPSDKMDVVRTMIGWSVGMLVTIFVHVIR